MDKQKTRKITDLMEDAMSMEDYRLRINLLVAGLMFEDPDADVEKIENCKRMLKEMSDYCKKGNKEEEKNTYLNETAKRIEKYLGR